MHSGEKPFSCKLCDKHYTSISTLSRHKKSPGHIAKSCSNLVHPPISFSFIKCEEVYIKEEIKEEGIFKEDPLSIKM